jgi:hypothetical protein
LFFGASEFPVKSDIWSDVVGLEGESLYDTSPLSRLTTFLTACLQDWPKEPSEGDSLFHGGNHRRGTSVEEGRQKSALQGCIWPH